MHYMSYRLIYCFIFCGLTLADRVQYLNLYVVKVNVTDISHVAGEVKKLGLTKQLDAIVPTIYVFERHSHATITNTTDVGFLNRLKTCCSGKVLAVEQVRHQTISLWPPPVEPVQPATGGDGGLGEQLPLTTTYGDIGVLKAWDRGYSGQGVTIAVTGVGIDTNLEDLKPNVNHALCYNAMNGTTQDVAPKLFPSYSESLPYTDHENNAAGLAAAAKNDNCGDGVAYGSNLIGVKTFNVKEIEWNKLDITETHVARGLGHAHDTVDIYSNSWSSVRDFGPDIGMATKESIKRGIERGRGGKGSVYVFPVGGINDGYDNNMHTITVNGVGKDRTVQKYTGRSASILTSTYGEASRSNTDLKTTSHTTHSQCISSFRGTSAATPIVAGIGALILQANHTLTWRDMQHVMVSASETNTLEDTHNFTRNGAGHLFHSQFGFGLLNASKAVELAETWTLVPEQNCVKVTMARQGCYQTHQEWICDAAMEIGNIGQAEHVTIVVSYKTPDEHNTNLVVISPSNTTSILMDCGQSDTNTATDRQDVTFLSVHFWGESVTGTWKVSLTHRHMGESHTSPSMHLVSINVCGTGHFSQITYPTTTVANDGGEATEHKKEGSATGAVLAMLYPVFVFIISGAIIIYFYPPNSTYR